MCLREGYLTHPRRAAQLLCRTRLGGAKHQRHAVQRMALACWCGTVPEDVPQMAAAVFNKDSGHNDAAILHRQVGGKRRSWAALLHQSAKLDGQDQNKRGSARRQHGRQNAKLLPQPFRAVGISFVFDFAKQGLWRHHRGNIVRHLGKPHVPIFNPSAKSAINARASSSSGMVGSSFIGSDILSGS